jgi:hypothetical protein
VGNYCPSAAILVFASGRVVRALKECDRWACSTCGPRRAEVVVAEASAASSGLLFAAELGPVEVKAATRAAQRHQLGRVTASRYDGGALLVTGEHLAASDRAWSLVEVAPADLLALMLARPVRRVDWSDHWRPEVKPAPPRTDQLVDRIPCGPRRLDQVLADSKVVQNGRATVGPTLAAVIIRAAVEGGRRRPSEHFHSRTA